MTKVKGKTKKKVAKSFEEEIQEKAKKMAEESNKLRLVKWLMKKNAEMLDLQSEIKRVIQECKEGNFNSLPALTTEETKAITQNWSQLDMLYRDTGRPAKNPVGVFTASTADADNAYTIANTVLKAS